MLVDTPENIADALNNCNIKEIKSVFYSHWDPDHTLGMRIFEQLYFQWLDFYEKIKPCYTVSVYAEQNVMRDLTGIRSKYGSFLDYYEKMGMIERRVLKNPVTLDNIKITAVPVSKNKAVSVFVFEDSGKKLVYAPCDCKPFPDDNLMYGSDILLIGNTFIGDALKDNRTLPENHPLRKELHSVEEVLEIKKKYNISRAIITHIEEIWGKSYDYYIELEKKYTEYNLKFAHDGMIIEL